MLFMVVLRVPFAVSAQRSKTAEDLCYKIEGHTDQRTCLDAQGQRSANALQAAEARLLAALKAWDQEPSYRSRAASLLSASATSFSQWRSSQCEVVASLAAGGNSAGDRRELCEIELNDRRARE
jgi:uncharacterized protein YecT (DUF1311 family)